MKKISSDQSAASSKLNRGFPKSLLLAILVTGLLGAAFLAGRLQEQSRLADTDEGRPEEQSRLADTDMDWLGSTDARIFKKVDWAAPIEDIVFSSMDSRSAGGTPTCYEMTHEAVTESGVEILAHTDLSRATDSDEWSLVRMLSTPINPDGPTVLTAREERDGLSFLKVIVRGSRTQPGQMRIEYDAENGERKSVVHDAPGGAGFASFPIEDAVGLGNIQVEIIN